MYGLLFIVHKQVSFIRILSLYFDKIYQNLEHLETIL